MEARHLFYVRLLSFLLIGCLLASCVNKVNIVAPQVVIINQTAQVISVVQYQSCNQSEDDWSVLRNSRLQSGERMQFEPLTDCVNLKAYYESGKVAGRQSNIRRSFPNSWVLR